MGSIPALQQTAGGPLPPCEAHAPNMTFTISKRTQCPRACTPSAVSSSEPSIFGSAPKKMPRRAPATAAPRQGRESSAHEDNHSSGFVLKDRYCILKILIFPATFRISDPLYPVEKSRRVREFVVQGPGYGWAPATASGYKTRPRADPPPHSAAWARRLRRKVQFPV